METHGEVNLLLGLGPVGGEGVRCGGVVQGGLKEKGRKEASKVTERRYAWFLGTYLWRARPLARFDLRLGRRRR